MAQLKLTAVTIKREADDYPDLSYLDQHEGATTKEERRYYREDQKRKASYGDDWHMLGIYAQAEYTINGTRQKVRTGGLWGIESDSIDKSYFVDVAKEEVGELRDMIEALGLNVEDFDKLALAAIADA